MWVITTRGFYSVVAHVDDSTRALVRARAREDLGALGLVSDLRIVETPNADHRWRASVDRAAWVAAVALIADAVDYPNFKSAVAEQQGWERAEPLHDVWTTLRCLQG
jgi:hypothetical protein